MAVVNPGAKKPSGGLGGVGKIVGGALGSVAGFVAGGPTGAASGWQYGSSMGEGLGGAIKGQSPGGAPQGPSAMERRASQFSPEVTKPSAVLKESLAALPMAPPEVQEQAKAPLMDAYQRALRKDFRGMA